jgi:sugar lactone lactonase YvrE
MWTGGILLNADGKVLSSGQHGIVWNDPATGASDWLVDSIAGAPINGVNEMIPDGEGGIVFGTSDMDAIVAGTTPQPVGLYRLTREREVIPLAEGIGFTNGLAYDPARQRLYCNDTFHATLAFDVGDDWALTGQRVLLEKEDCDGMALDAEGNVWVTGFRSQFIERVAPDGSLLSRIETPEGSVTQVRFGGGDARDFYLTVVPADGGDTLKQGGQITEERSHLYRGRSEVPGVLIGTSGFTLG